MKAGRSCSSASGSEGAACSSPPFGYGGTCRKSFDTTRYTGQEAFGFVRTG